MRSIARTASTTCALVCGVGCLARQPEPLPALCVPGFAQGQTLSVRLGGVYDATSDALYDPSTITPVGASYRLPTCGGVDGLGPGSLVTLTLGPQLGSGDVVNETCTPLAQASPALPVDAWLLWRAVLVAPAETMAVSWTPVSGSKVPSASVEGLLSPSRNPMGTAVARALPPLVLTRTLATLDPVAGPDCFDAWVATWEPPP
jgi:hypothetical protein